MFKKNPSITPEIKSSSRILFDEINFNFKLSKKIPGMEELALQNEILEEIVEIMAEIIWERP